MMMFILPTPVTDTVERMGHFRNSLSSSTRALIDYCEVKLRHNVVEIYPRNVRILSRLYKVDESLAKQAKIHLGCKCIIKGLDGISDYECMAPPTMQRRGIHPYFFGRSL
jgi:phosphoenolpyruvate carboxylase